MKDIYLNWKNYHCLVLKLSKKINFKPDFIVCINRGGLVIGCLLSQLLNKPLAVIAAESYQGKRKGKLCIGTIASLKPIKGKILLVDDLVDSGETMKRVIEKVKRRQGVKEVKTACLFKKPMAKLTPDYFVKEVNGWVVFPYEAR